MDFLKKSNLKIKNTLLFGLLIVIFVFLVFPFSTSAWSWSGIASFGAGAVTSLAGVILLIPAYLSYLAALVTGALLDWVTGPNFISLSYTDPARNQVIEIGLNITKQFVNMGLVVVLIFIALAIALRLKEYASQKTLIRLIAVALLVNFAPVICGLIVDAANIIMNYFLAGVSKGISAALTESTASFGTFKQLIKSFGDFEQAAPLFAQVAVYMILNIAIAFSFFLISAIFIVRYIAIWILVILAPLAFVAWILPATKKFWDQWWQQFIQWSIIGIPIAFFLYLAMNSFIGLREVFQAKIKYPGLEADASAALGVFNNVFPYFLVIVMLWLGLIIGLQTSAMGASGIMDFAKSKGKAGVKAGWQATKWGARKTSRGIQLARENFAKTDKGRSLAAWGKTQLAKQKWGEGKAGFWGAAARTSSIINPGRYIMRGLGRLAGGKIPQDARTDIKAAEDSVKDIEETPVLVKKFQDAVTDTKRIGILNKIIEKNKIKDALDEDQFGESAINEKEIERLMKHAKDWKADKKLNAAFPHLATKYVTDPELAKARVKDPLLRNKTDLIISQIKPEDYRNMTEKALDNIDVVDAILLKAMGGHISKLIEEHGAVAAKKIEDRIDAGRPVGKRAKRYLVGQAGRALVSPQRKQEDWEPEETAKKEAEWTIAEQEIAEWETKKKKGEERKKPTGVSPTEGA